MNILAVISPLIIIASVGYLACKTAWLNKSQLDAVSKVTFHLCIPAFLFYRMATANLEQGFNLSVLSAFYVPVLVCYGLAWLSNHYFHQQYQRQHNASAVFALGASYSNNIIVGIPILLMAIGEQALPTIFLIVTFHSAMLFGLTSFLAAKSGQFNLVNFLKQAFYNPFILAILSGMLVNISGLELPSFAATSLQMLGQPAITLALFVLGASLAQYQIRQEWRFVSIAALLKLAILPALVFVTASHLFELPKQTIVILTVLSSCPTGVNAYLIAKAYNSHQATVASSVVVSTLLASLTIPLWLLWLL